MKEWHLEAQALRAQGLTLDRIARILGRHYTSILYATDAEFRRRKSAYKKKLWASLSLEEHAQELEIKKIKRAANESRSNNR